MLCVLWFVNSIVFIFLKVGSGEGKGKKEKEKIKVKREKKEKYLVEIGCGLYNLKYWFLVFYWRSLLFLF